MPKETKLIANTELDRAIAVILFSGKTDANKKRSLTNLIPQTPYADDPKAFWDIVQALSCRLDIMSDLLNRKPTKDTTPLEIMSIYNNKQFAAQLAGIASTLSIDSISLVSALNAFTSGLLNSDTALSIRGLRSPAITWNVIVANSGDGKSRVLSSIQSYLALRQAEAEESYKKAKKAWDGYLDEVKDYNPEPQKPNLYENTATIAALVKRLKGQKQGTLLISDELIGFFGGLGRYGNKGNMGDDDRAQLLSLWGGLPTKVSRVSEDSCHFAQKPRLSIFGGMQPKRFDALIHNDVDGLSARILPVVMQSIKTKFMGMCRNRRSNWEYLVKDYGDWLIENRDRFVNLTLDDDWDNNPEHPTFMKWTNFCYSLETMEGVRNDLERAWLSKTRDHLSRIMIPMHILSCYVAERDGGVANAEVISMETLEEAMRMFNVHWAYYRTLVRGNVKDKVAKSGGSTVEIVDAILEICREDGYVTAREVVRKLNIGKLAKECYERTPTELANDILSVMLGQRMVRMERVGKQIRFFIQEQAPEAPEAPEATPEATPEAQPASNVAPPNLNLSLDTKPTQTTPPTDPDKLVEYYYSMIEEF